MIDDWAQEQTVDLWRIRSPEEAPGADSMLCLLSDAERERAAAIRPTGMRNLYVSSHAAARSILAQATGTTADRLSLAYSRCPVCGQPHGKPFVPGLYFNISRSRETALVAVTKAGDVGVDVEDYRRMSSKMPLYVLSSDERRLVRESSTPVAKFLRIWTRKEAHVKALGLGLTVDLASIRTSPARVQSLGESGRRTQVIDMSSGGYAAAVAIRTESVSVLVLKRRDWNWSRVSTR